MCFEKIKIDQLLQAKDVCERKQFRYLLDQFQRKYRELYYDTSFINHSVFLNNSNQIYIPLTLNKKNNKYSFYGNPIEIFSKNLISKKDYLKIQNFFEKLKFEKLFKFQIEHDQNLIDTKNSNVEQIINEIFIDLSKTIDEIKSNFTSNLRNEIKKNYEDTKFEIIDKKNYKKNEIFEMMKFHKKIAGRVTRSEKTWKQNEEMILNDRGFLVKATHKNKLISFSFFFNNNFSCHYSSSVADREYFSQIRNLHHKSLWIAIEYAKTKCNFFNIGSTTIYSKRNISDKEKNIEKFKSKFKGINLKFIILNDLPKYEFYKNFLYLG